MEWYLHQHFLQRTLYSFRFDYVILPLSGRIWPSSLKQSAEQLRSQYCFICDGELVWFCYCHHHRHLCLCCLHCYHCDLEPLLLTGFPRVLISGKSPYFQLLPSRPWKSPYFWIFSIEVREKSWFSIAVSKPGWSTSSCVSWGFPSVVAMT